jgi:hypothetical protein
MLVFCSLWIFALISIKKFLLKLFSSQLLRLFLTPLKLLCFTHFTLVLTWSIEERRRKEGIISWSKDFCRNWGQDLKQKSWRFHFTPPRAHCALGTLVPVKTGLSLSAFTCLAAVLTFIWRFWNSGSCMAANISLLPSQT